MTLDTLTVWINWIATEKTYKLSYQALSRAEYKACYEAFRAENYDGWGGAYFEGVTHGSTLI